MDVERIAVSAVTDSISKTDLLTPSFNTGDKEPVYDGHVSIHRGKTKKKEGLKRVPVQIKGKTDQNINQNIIKHRVDTATLDVYFHNGGVMFFVVLISKNGDKKQIYYSDLQVTKLKRILEAAKNKKTTSLSLKKFPEDNKEKEALFLNLYDDIKKQTSFIDHNLPTLKEISREDKLESIIVSYKYTGNQTPDILRLAVQNELCLYGRSKDNILAPAPTPLKDTLTEIRTGDIEASIAVNGKVYYKSFKRIISKDIDEIIIGNSFFLKINHSCHETHVTIKPTLILKDALIDLPFILDVVECGHFESDGSKFILGGIKQSVTDEWTNRISAGLEYCRRIGRLFEALRLNTDYDLEQMTDNDWTKTRILYETIINGNSTKELTGPLDRIGSLQYLNTKLLLGFNPAEKPGEYFISDLFQDDSIKLHYDDGSERIPVPRFMFMSIQDFQEVRNIDYEEIIKSFSEYSDSPHFFKFATNLLYRMIAAYDRSRNERKDILENARLFASAITSKITDDMGIVLARLNQIQIEKRLRDLNEQEKEELISYVEKPFYQDQDIEYVIRTSSYLLLEDTERVSQYFHMMNKGLQEHFSKNYPVYRFWKE